MTINYASEDLKARIRELTGGRGADVVYDPVGGQYSEPALRATAWEGRFLVIGFAAGEIPAIPLYLTLLKGCDIVGVFWGAFVGREPEHHLRNVEELVGWWRAGKLRPHVSSTYPLDRAGEAIRSSPTEGEARSSSPSATAEHAVARRFAPGLDDARRLCTVPSVLANA
jgi:NADPH2:quinone reductase